MRGLSFLSGAFAAKMLLVQLLLSLMTASLCAASPADRALAGKQRRVITFVYFPMAVPVAVLGEVLERDRVLQKALERAGCSIEFRTLAKGNDALPLIKNNQVDAILFSDMPSIEAVSMGDMVIAGTVKRSYASVVARNRTMLEQLRRKKVANVFGSTSHYALLQGLASVQLAEQDVALVQMEMTQMPEALAQGKIDAFAAWEPIPTAALKRYPGQFSVIHRQVSLSFYLVSQRLLQQNPAAADAIGAAVIRSVRWLRKGNNLATASLWALSGMADFSGKSSALSAADIAEITKTDLLDVAAAPLIPLAEKGAASALGREFDFLKAIGKLPPQAARERFQANIRPELLQRLLENHSRHQLNSFDYEP